MMMVSFNAEDHEQARGDGDVVQQRGDGPRGEANAEAEGDVAEDQQAGDPHGVEAVAAQLGPHPRPDILHPLDVHGAHGVSQGKGEAIDDLALLAHGALAAAGLGRFGQPRAVRVGERAVRSGDAFVLAFALLQAEADQKLRGVALAVAHDRGIADAAGAHDAANRSLVGARLGVEEHLHFGAAREVDSVAHALDPDRGGARENQRRGDRRAEVALSDEINLGPGRDDLQRHVLLPA
jgi:hypothetical protein